MDRSTFGNFKRAIVILIIVLLLDISIRVIFHSDFKVVISLEALLFIFISALLLFAAKKDKSVSKKDYWAAFFFILGGIRAGLWALGIDVYKANIVILLLGIVLSMIFIRWSKKLHLGRMFNKWKE